MNTANCLTGGVFCRPCLSGCPPCSRGKTAPQRRWGDSCNAAAIEKFNRFMFPSSQFGFYGRRGFVVAAWEGRFLPLLGG